MESSRGGRSLRQAVVTALALLALLTVVYLIGRDAFFVLAAAVILIALVELVRALISSGRRINGPFTVLCAAAILVVAYVERPAYFGVVIAATTVGSLLLAMRPARGTTAASDAAWTLLAVTWIGGGGAGAISMLMLDDGGLELLIASVLIVALDDIGAYFIGSRFGRRRMAPHISPGKSWEGFAGGFVAALAGGVAFGLLLDELTVLHGIALGAIAGSLAPVGDLVESLAKREIGIKDSGRLLPGHGGFLDLLDAIIFCAPAMFLYLRFVVF